MPEAVIVDAVFTPIGRAFKGSLAQQRPDEMGAFIVDQLLERNPDVDPATRSRTCSAAAACPRGSRPAHRPHHLSSLRAACRKR